MTLTEWDKTVSPHLHSIEGYCRMLASDVRCLISSIRLLPIRPDFPTKASFEIAAAERDLMQALEVVRAAKQLYAEKPAEKLSA